jgi:tripartite-type tricarboxylate transporter receptor subunit TctC
MSHSNVRRRLILGAAGAMALAHVARASAQGYPTKNIRVVVPTAQGGSADRLARVFDDFWGPLLKTHFEYGFYAGAAGQVGYETFVSKRDRDGHNLLFGNMGPEMIMYALQKPPYKFPEDYQYFCRLDVDDSIVFVNRNSKFKKIEDIVAEGKKRTVNVAVSRLPHPASIGMLALGRATGAKFNLIPYGGGNPTYIAVLNGEAEVGALPITGVLSLSDRLRVLGVFNRENIFAKETDNAPTVNSVFSTNIPDLYSSRAWAIHTEWADANPQHFDMLQKTAEEAHKSAVFKDAFEKSGAPTEALRYGDRKVCTDYALSMVDFARRYEKVLSAQK